MERGVEGSNLSGGVHVSHKEANPRLRVRSGLRAPGRNQSPILSSERATGTRRLGPEGSCEISAKMPRNNASCHRSDESGRWSEERREDTLVESLAGGGRRMRRWQARGADVGWQQRPNCRACTHAHGWRHTV
eukprot:1734459-Rhodomonas_salina.1